MMITYAVTLNPRRIPANPTGPALVRLATAAPVINDTDSAARRKQSRTFCRIYFRAGREGKTGKGENASHKLRKSLYHPLTDRLRSFSTISKMFLQVARSNILLQPPPHSKTKW